MAQNTIHSTVVGRLAADPEQCYTNDDQPLCHLQHRAVLEVAVFTMFFGSARV